VTAKVSNVPIFPLPVAIEQAFDHSTLKDYSEDELAQLLGVSSRWLQYQRQRGLPPPFYSPNRSNLIRYPHDALMDWKRGEVARSMAEAKAAYEGRNGAKAEPKPTKEKRRRSDPEHVMGVRLGPAAIHGLDEPVVRGGRPRKMPATFAGFLTSTNTDDEWLFSLRGVVQRPVDFLGMMAQGVERQANEDLVWLTLERWVEQMRVALEREAGAKVAAARLLELNARVTTPGKPKGRS